MKNLNRRRFCILTAMMAIPRLPGVRPGEHHVSRRLAAETPDLPEISDLRRLSVRARFVLRSLNIATVRELIATRPSVVLNGKCSGITMVEQIRNSLREIGIHW